MASNLSKRGSLMIFHLILGNRKSHRDQKLVNKEAVPVQWCSSWPGTAQSTQFCYFLYVPKSSVIIFQHCLLSYQTDLRSLKQSTNNCHTPPALPTPRWPQSYLLNASCFWNYHSTLWTSCTTQKFVSAVCISIHFQKHFKCLWRSFPWPDQKFLLLLILHCS